MMFDLAMPSEIATPVIAEDRVSATSVDLSAPRRYIYPPLVSELTM